MDCPYCGKPLEEGEISITGGFGGTIYWVPKGYTDKHWAKMTQLPRTIKKEGGVIISGQTTNVSEPLVAYQCPHCKKVIIDY